MSQPEIIREPADLTGRIRPARAELRVAALQRLRAAVLRGEL